MSGPRSPKQTHIGPLGKGSRNVPHYIAERIVLDVPTRITNAGSKTPYSQKAAWSTYIRPERLVAFSLPSRDGFSVPSTQGEVQPIDSMLPDSQARQVSDNC